MIAQTNSEFINRSTNSGAIISDMLLGAVVGVALFYLLPSIGIPRLLLINTPLRGALYGALMGARNAFRPAATPIGN